MKFSSVLLILICWFLLVVSVTAQNILYQTYTDRGKAAFESGNVSDAEKLMKSALVEAEKLKNPELIATAKVNIGRIFHSQEKFDEAEPFYLSAIEIYSDIDGENGERSAFALNNLGLLYTEQKKFEKGEVSLRKALTIREKTLGGDDPNVAITLINLGKLYSDQEKYIEADAVYVQALQIFKLDPEYKNEINICLFNLTLVTESLKNFKRAEAAHKMLISINEKSFGTRSKELIPYLESYSSFLKRIKRKVDASKVDIRISSLRRLK